MQQLHTIRRDMKVVSANISANMHVSSTRFCIIRVYLPLLQSTRMQGTIRRTSSKTWNHGRLHSSVSKRIHQRVADMFLSPCHQFRVVTDVGFNLLTGRHPGTQGTLCCTGCVSYPIDANGMLICQTYINTRHQAAWIIR